MTLKQIHNDIKRLDKMIENSRTPETVYVYQINKTSPYCPEFSKIRNQDGLIDSQTVEEIWKNSNQNCRWPTFFPGYVYSVVHSELPIMHQLIVHKGKKAIFHHNPQTKKQFLYLGRNNVAELGKMTVFNRKDTPNLEYLKITSIFKNFD